MTPVIDSYELSPLQAGMLFHAAAAGDPGVDVEQVVATLHEPLDESAFLRAWERLLERHAALRSRFRWQGLAQPVQEVVDRARIPVQWLDWRALAAPERRARLEALVEEQRVRGFDIAQAPLMRLALVRMGEAEHVMLWTIHHLLSDGRSRLRLLQELFACYEGKALPPPQPYRGYVEWLRGVEHERSAPYWRELLAGFRSPTPLVVCRESAPGTPPAYGTRELRLPAALTAALRKRAREARVTLNLLLQGAWALLLHRYSGESDVVFGVTRDVRPRALAGAGEIVGLLINTLPVRIRVDPEAPLVAWLAGLRGAQLAAREYAHTPLVQVHGWSDVPRELPLFETLFVFDRRSLDAELRRLGGAWTRRAVAVRNRTSYPLTLAAYGDDELVLELQYSRRRLDDDAVQRMGGHLRSLLEGMAAGPQARLRELRLLTAAEERELQAWRGTSVPYPPARCVHELVEEQARLRPGALAAQDGGRALTYGELDERAGRLAARLRRRGVRPDSLVAVQLGRSADLLVALLAVWKAGAAYVPIDPGYPAERVRFILQDSGAPLVLTPASLAELLEEPEPHGDDRGAPAPADRLAYLIYTSGSTGAPKGVPITHRSLHNLVCWHRQAYQVTPADRASQVASPAFDGAVWEIWPYLCAGASLHIPDEATRLDARRLVRWIAEQRLTLAFLPTPLAQAALREPWPGSCALRALLTGGDTLGSPPARKPPFRVVNHYGPTENTVVSTCAEVPAQGRPPIGRPLPNTEAWVVDRELRPVPVGVPGELLVGGAQLSPGYWKRPQLTAAAFVHDAGKRLYRTGDRVRWLPDGNLEFLGRLDEQVKIRGFRVEPGEIEALIRRHPAVREAVVLARDDQLVAYFAAEQEIVEELRAQLQAHLPPHMLPAHFVRLAALPLTRHGKLDRRALPPPAPPRPQGGAARTPLERSLAGIWAEVLGLERVGIDEDFFALGGHSLAAMQVVSRVREALGVELGVRELFDGRTVARVARRLAAVPGAAGAPPIVPGAADAGELSFSQQRLWFLDLLQPQAAAYVIPLALELRGRLDAAALERAARELLRRHEALRTVFPEAGGRPIQEVREAPEPALAFAEPSGEADLERMLAEETRRPFDLARGPLFRATLYRLAAERHVLLLAMHHIVCDGWSIGILARELAHLYRHGAAGLPAPGLQYRDYARWERQWLRGERLEKLSAHWRARLAGAPQVLALPADRPRPAVESSRGARYRFALPLALTEALHALARREGATLFMTLLAGFALLLARYSGQRDLLIGTPVANRGRAQLEGVVGCFVNMVVLRAELSGAPGAAQLIARLREACLDAFAHQALPFDRLVEALQPARDLARHPLFQVMFALRDAPERAFDLPGIAVRTLEVDPGSAKADLSLEVQETPQGLAGGFEYATDLFDEATIARMAAHWQVLLEAMAAAPERPVWQLELLTPDERAALAQWSRGEARTPALGCVHWQIEAQASRTPDDTAVVFEDREITYAELDRRANALAARLVELGVGPDRRVGVHCARSIEMVVAVLAVLKAGAAYVPLDPGLPAERLRDMAADADLAVVLTQRALAQPFERLLYVDEALPGEGGAPATAVAPEHLAYLIYTSGSTGRPKGVMVEHRNVTRFFAAMDACIARAHSDTGAGTWLALTSLSFDISVLELLWTLARGFKVVIQGQPAPSLIARELERHGVTHLQCTPTAARLLLAEPRARAALAGLRQMLVGGEVLPAALARELRAAVGGELRNMYGPTETTVWSATEPVQDEDPVPIGRPLANTRIDIVDDFGEPLPIGVPGELVIGGAGVARGYWKRPELTQQRFFSRDGQRFYRTGDRGRRLPDGRIQFLGRTDRQVKIRGYRVELGEIEGVLAGHPAVAAAAVALHDASLVAYVVGDAPLAELRAHLRARLPDYMLPADFVRLERLPLTSNGKLDRGALPAPEPAAAARFTAPGTPTERALAELWQRMLRAERIGARDNFFECGGHSLLAMQLLGRVRERFGVELPLKHVFERPTLSAQARAIDALVWLRESKRGHAGEREEALL